MARNSFAPRSWSGTLLVTGSAVLFAFNGVVSKTALQAGLSTMHLVQMRTAGAALLMFAVAFAVNRRGLRATGRELAGLAALGVVGVALVLWLYLVAIERLPVGIALLLEYTAPLLVALWARFVLGERVRSRVWLALALTLIGLTMVAQVGRGFSLDVVGVA
ncbi:MAG: DMT family transporter, partial [Actinomycetales bacterium]|nr:DMT family transporter [Actinomycetales bacterium]